MLLSTSINSFTIQRDTKNGFNSHAIMLTVLDHTFGYLRRDCWASGLSWYLDSQSHCFRMSPLAVCGAQEQIIPSWWRQLCRMSFVVMVREDLLRALPHRSNLLKRIDSLESILPQTTPFYLKSPTS